MNIQSYGSMMEHIGAARQRWLDQASAGVPSAASFNPTLQSQQIGTTGSANAAGLVSSTTDIDGDGQTAAQAANGTQLRRHHHSGMGGMGNMFNSDSLAALLGTQETGSTGTGGTNSATPATSGSISDAPATGITTAGQSGLLASIESAVQSAISSYFGSPQSAGTAASSLVTATA